MPLFASYRDFVRLESKVDAILAGLNLVYQQEIEMDQVLADLTNAVEQTKTTQASAIVLINGIAARVDALNVARDASISTLTAQLRASAATLATAVDAQAPVVPPVVATTPPTTPAP